MTERASFTGRARRRQTRRGVVVADRAARALITVGGIGTILAVLGVALFLVWVVAPLFLPAKVRDIEAPMAAWADGPLGEPLHLGVDEYRILGWTLTAAGTIEVFRLDDGSRRAEIELFADGALTAASFLLQGDQAVFGLADGSVQTATIGFASSIVELADLPPDVRRRLETASAGAAVDHGAGVAQRTPTGQARVTELAAELGEATPVAGGPVRRVRHVVTTNGPLIVALAEEPAADGHELRLLALVGEERSNFLTGRRSVVFDAPAELPFPRLAPGVPRFLELTGNGSDVLLGWESGELARLRVARLDDVFVAEQGRLVAGGTRLTAMAFLLGNRTLVWGDSRGAVHAGFLIRREDYAAAGEPGQRPAGMTQDPRATDLLVDAKTLAPAGEAAVTALAPSARSRLLFAGFADGRIRLSNVTNEALLAEVRPAEGPVASLVTAPKEDGLLALAGGRLVSAAFDPGYPEASFKALFLPVWYEGYGEPLHVWQSSGGTDDFEPKLGLYPLIFGTLKATVYSMLFGAPLALLAAVFTSEFLHPRTRALVKPAIELMASLPSVVLGFLAALVIAPFVEDLVPAVLMLFFTVPLAFLVGAHLWQLLPAERAIRLQRRRFAFIGVVAPLGVGLAVVLGPLVERRLFGGDVRAWLAWEPGGEERFASAAGGWLLLLLPLAALAVAWANGRFVSPRLRERGADWDRRRFAATDAVRFVLCLAAGVALAAALAGLLDALGFDPRGGLVDTYVQRNALIVGFVMGFAVIPIIYTISEDALSTVPEHLRSASLGAGATQWQTAVRIVIPTAMSGLFSALMVGLGRAVGETMIVLMAAGNTPVMDWNVFEGFRTLSANIAVEMPEAVKGSTHYRTLFLAALVLFVMTFLVNTVAEAVRLRFRKRAYQL